MPNNSEDLNTHTVECSKKQIVCSQTNKEPIFKDQRQYIEQDNNEYRQKNDEKIEEVEDDDRKREKCVFVEENKDGRSKQSSYEVTMQDSSAANQIDTDISQNVIQSQDQQPNMRAVTTRNRHISIINVDDNDVNDEAVKCKYCCSLVKQSKMSLHIRERCPSAPSMTNNSDIQEGRFVECWHCGISVKKVNIHFHLREKCSKAQSRNSNANNGQFVECKHCGTSVKKASIGFHVKEKCSYTQNQRLNGENQVVTCKYCQCKVKKACISTHLKEDCQAARIQCEYCQRA